MCVIRFWHKFFRTFSLPGETKNPGKVRPGPDETCRRTGALRGQGLSRLSAPVAFPFIATQTVRIVN
ncbi:tubulin polymerization-promoting protein family member 3-like protein [Anopheles sinensis]|uniref:Tubulin polymerization-promoting protein family member 3-like protein n=1 Tax=Anopheles sinensis TaxID=74873 RepID=A0A084WR06_ANOSI|nr:tubulin polymerization-promoting protein family member 3-like protein [Anopheles sinensis]